MIQDIGNQIYHCEYRPAAPNPETDYILVYQDDRILFFGESLPRLADFRDLTAPDALQFLFTISETSFFMPMLPPTLPAEGASPLWHYESIQRLRGLTPRWLAFAGVTGYHLAAWYQHNRYCGSCAAKLLHKEDERALVCPQCGRIIFPEMAVAVIVGVTDGDRILFSKYAGGSYRNYALIAGFCEIGETLEQTVRREVYEEVGLHIKNIRYFGNQPWGFSQSMLVGFFADLDGSPEIHLQEEELSEAVWVKRDEMEENDTSVSLTSELMEAFRLGKER